MTDYPCPGCSSWPYVCECKRWSFDGYGEWLLRHAPDLAIDADGFLDAKQRAAGEQERTEGNEADL